MGFVGGFGRNGDGLDSAACADPRLLRSHSATDLEAVDLNSGILESRVGGEPFKFGSAAGGVAAIPLRPEKYRSRRAAHKRCAGYALENPP